MEFLIPWNEVSVSVTRSSGAGGQHVNKTNSAVQIRFCISTSLVLTDTQKQLILKKLAHKLIKDDEIMVRVEEERDQKRNKERAYFLLNHMITQALIVPKKRFATKPTRNSVKRRLTEKTKRSEVKKNRSGKISRDD